MELAIYIKNLLYNHNKVFIPGFGVLQTVYKSANINIAGNTISPPVNTLIFNSTLANPDDLLALFIAAKKSIDQATAEEFISNQIKLLTEKLNSAEIILLEGIGYFSKENGTIKFDPEQGANYLTRSFGLSKINYKPVDFKLSPKHSEQPATVPKKRKFAYTLLFLLIVILVGGGGVATYLYYPSVIGKLKNVLKKQTVTVVPKNIDTLTVPKKDTTKENDLEKFVDKSTDKKRALAIKDEIVPQKIHVDTSYYVIAGSFKTFQRASILAKQLKKEGYTPEVIQFDQQLFRVSLGEFKDKPQATAELDKIKATKGPDAVWLLTKKL